MNILLFTIEYPPNIGGIANYYGNMVKYWPASNKHQIIVLDNSEQKLLNNKFPFLQWLPGFYSLFKKIIKDKIDYVIVGHVLPLGTITWLINKALKFNYAVFLHGTDLAFALKVKRKKWLTKKILNNSSLIICANGHTAKQAANFLGKKEKIKVVNPGIDLQTKFNFKLIEELKRKHSLANKIVLFSIGRFVERKSFDYIIKVMPELLKQAPNLVYAFAGRGIEEKKLKQLIKNLRLEKNVAFLGKISDEEKWAWLKLCDIFITTSREIKGDYEGFGIVYLEANLAGKPVIAGDSGGVRDAVKDYENGILVDPDNLEAIQEGILELAKDKNLRQQLGQQGWRRAIEKFNWDIQTRKIYYLVTRNNPQGDKEVCK